VDVGSLKIGCPRLGMASARLQRFIAMRGDLFCLSIRSRAEIVL
jgi:hypothetical protein